MDFAPGVAGVLAAAAVAGFVVVFAALPEDFAADFAPEVRVLRVAVGLLGLSAGGFAAGFVAGRVLAVEWRPGFLASELPVEFVVSLTSKS